jgi:hypothetical protein
VNTSHQNLSFEEKLGGFGIEWITLAFIYNRQGSLEMKGK